MRQTLAGHLLWLKQKSSTDGRPSCSGSSLKESSYMTLVPGALLCSIASIIPYLSEVWQPPWTGGSGRAMVGPSRTTCPRICRKILPCF